MKTMSFHIGNKRIGGGNSVLIQTRNRIKTSFVEKNLAEIVPLVPLGLDRIRFSVLDREDALSLKNYKNNLTIPIIADIHYNPGLAFSALENGADKIRINPGNFESRSQLLNLIHICKEKGIPLRIGVNSGSLNRYKGKTGSPIEDYFLALEDTLSVFEEERFDRIVLSLKSSDIERTKALYEKASYVYSYPLHIGLTESGFGYLGARKSTAAVLPLLKEGIGDTMRVSLADERIEEIRACKELLKLSGRRKNLPDLIVCPGCGRRAENRAPIARIVQTFLDTLFKDVKVAVRGCPVNGIGEAKDCNFGLAGTGKKNLLLYFRKGKPIGNFPVETALKRLQDDLNQ